MFNMIATTTLFIFLWIRDGFYMLIFSEFTPAAKLKYQPCLRDLWGFLSTSATITMVVTPLHYMHLATIDKVNYGLDSLGLVFLEFFLMMILQDLSMFNYVREWMLQNAQVFKRLRAEHHSSRKSLQAINALRFHPLDLIVESASGPLIAIAFWWVLGYSQVHISSASFYLLVRAGALERSSNMNTLVTGIPLYDMIFKMGMAHNIHHAKPNEHTTIIPYHHIFPERRAADCAAYRKLFPLEEEFNYDTTCKKM